MCVRRLLISGSKVRVLDGPPIVSATSEASGVADAVFATTWVIELVYRDLIPQATSRRAAVTPRGPNPHDTTFPDSDTADGTASDLTPASKRPAFAALVEFQILEALAAPGLAQAEVELAHVLIAAQLGGWALEYDAAVLHDVAVVGDTQRDLRVLLDEQERRLLLVVDLADDVEDLAHQQRRQPQRRLIQQQKLRLCHERATEDQHLLLAAAQISRDLVAAGHQDGEVVVDHPQISLHALRILARVGTDPQILLDGERLQHLASFHDLHHAPATDVLRIHTVDPPVGELDAAVGHAAALGLEQAGDCLQRRGLPRPVGAQQGDDLALGHLQRQPLEDEDDVAVDDLDVVQPEHRARHARYLPIHFMSRSTDTSRTKVTLPSLISTRRARLVGRWSSLVYVKGGVMPHVSHSLRLSSAFFTLSPVGLAPARLMASAAMRVHSHPRM